MNCVDGRPYVTFHYFLSFIRHVGKKRFCYRFSDFGAVEWLATSWIYNSERTPRHSASLWRDFLHLADGDHHHELIIRDKELNSLSFSRIGKDHRQNPAALGRLLKTEGMEPNSNMG